MYSVSVNMGHASSLVIKSVGRGAICRMHLDLLCTLFQPIFRNLFSKCVDKIKITYDDYHFYGAKKATKTISCSCLFPRNISHFVLDLVECICQVHTLQLQYYLDDFQYRANEGRLCAIIANQIP